MLSRRAVQRAIFGGGARAPQATNLLAFKHSAAASMMATPSFSASNFGLFQFPRRFFAPEGGPSDTPSDSTFADQPEYIREMKDPKDWQDALENRKRPVMIQAGAAWCGPCNILKPMLIDAVKAHDGKLEYLYVDIDEHQNIAQLLRIQHVPVVYLVRDGNLIDQFSGVPTDSDKIEQFIQKGFVEMKPLEVEKLNEGEGEIVPKGANVKVHYTGKLPDGTVFDSSVERGQPIEFQVGVGQVIRGWDEGITQLKKGQKAILTCPPYYAYGKQGAGDVIPPDATLIFEVEVVDFTA